LALIERHFKVSRAGSAKITRAPFNVKGPVGRCAGDYGKDAIAGLISAQVVLIREDSLAYGTSRQGTACAQIRCIARELQITVGTDERTVKARPVQEDREWERNAGGAIIAVVACVQGPGHDRTGAGSCLVVAAGCRGTGRRRRCRCRRRSWADSLEPKGDVTEVPRSSVADECARPGHRVDCVNSVAVSRRREQRAIGGAHAQTIIILIDLYGADAVGINRRDGVQRRAIKVGIIERELIKRAIGSKTDPTALARLGIAYERRNGRTDVDGVQKASTTEPVTIRAYPVEHAGARLEANIADTDWRPVIGDRTDRGDQGAGIGIDLDERAGAY
jgi:hypothetical protein